MEKINNVNLQSIQNFEEVLKNGSESPQKTMVTEGEWLVNDGAVQFQSNVSFEEGNTTFKIDNPTFMGGSGQLPGPMHYCFFGLASCYTGTFATMASMLGVKINKLTTKVEADVNFSKVFGLGDFPIMEEVRVKLFIESDSEEEKIKQAEVLALERCPVVFTLKNPVKLEASLQIN